MHLSGRRPLQLGADRAGPDPVSHHPRGPGPLQDAVAAARKDGGAEDVSASAAIMGLYTRRLWINRFNLAVSLLTMLIGLFWLGWILLTLFQAGFKSLGPALFYTMTPPPGGNGGLSNAIAGSRLMPTVGTRNANPKGNMSAVYAAPFG